MLRLRRELNTEELGGARCHVCGKIFRAFLLECSGCNTIMCLDCRDQLWARAPEELAGTLSQLAVGEVE